MIPCVIFLNELSYAYDGEKTPVELLQSLLSALNGIKAIQRTREDLIVAGSSPISKIPIGDGAHSVASLLRSNQHKEEWRFIRGLDQSGPGDQSWPLSRPHPSREVTFEGKQTFGMLWAHESGSLIVSLALSPSWSANRVAAQLEEMGEAGKIHIQEITIANVSRPDHANDHFEIIANYGRALSASSVIYQGNDFVGRMYFFDHNPPHFHVCSVPNPSKTLATFRIDTQDVLSGNVSGRTQRVVRTWVSAHTDQLAENWRRCKNGQHPFVIND